MSQALPKGFVLDKAPVINNTSLPEGFTLDTSEDTTQVTDDSYRPELTQSHEPIQIDSVQTPDPSYGGQMDVGRMQSAPTGQPKIGVSHTQAKASPAFDNPVVQFGIGAMEAMKNYPEDAMKVFKETISALSPIPKKESVMDEGYKTPLVETAKAGTKLLAGAAQKLIPGEQQEEKILDTAIDEMVNKYGSKADLLNVIKSRPAEFTADLSSVLTGAGGLTKLGAKVPGLSKLAKPAATATKVGASIEPFNVMKKIISEPVRVLQKGIPGLKDVPMEWYKGAAKFPTAKHITEAHRNKWTKTALYNEIMPTHKGLIKLGKKIDAINTEISKLVEGATKTGKKMNLDELFEGLEELKRDAGTKGGTDPVKMQRQIDSVKNSMKRGNTMLKKGEIGPAYKTDFTPTEAQDIKKGIYKDLKGFYTVQKNEAGRVLAGKKIAKNTKEFLEVAIPEIKELNWRDGDLIDLYDNLTRPSTRIGNLNSVPMDLATKVTAGTVAGGPIGTAMGAITGIFDMPKNKAKLAIVLNKLERQGVKLSPSSAAFRDMIYQSGKAADLETETEEQ